MGNDEAADTGTPVSTALEAVVVKPIKDDDTVPEDNEPATARTNKKLLNLRFLFANRDGLSVSIHCDPADTVGQIKGALISRWPKGKQCDFTFFVFC
jgi:hypothetical protein